MGTLLVCFKYLVNFNVLQIKLTCLAFLWYSYCFTVFEAVLKYFQRVNTGSGVPLANKTRLQACSEPNHDDRVANAKYSPGMEVAASITIS